MELSPLMISKLLPNLSQKMGFDQSHPTSMDLGRGIFDSPKCVQISSNQVQGHDYKAHLYDFHIIYRSSYQVPVLYFLGDLWPLGFDNFEQDLPQNSLEALREAKWTFITLAQL